MITSRGVPAERSGRPTSAAGPLRQLAWGSSALSFSILADSAMEHYRGGFYNRTMYAAPFVSALTLAAGSSMAMRPEHADRVHRTVFGTAALTGLVGLGFHTYNTARRIGGWSWQNLFYGAPLAAPLGLTAAGLLGFAAMRVGQATERRTPRLLGVSAGRTVAAGAAVGLLGTEVEAGVLHFRGAFHRPAMFIPVTVPPLAALALGLAALRPTRSHRRLARRLLRVTAAVGLGGMGFHAQGVQRSMGGWRNWSQNLLTGPPLPAPPSFTGMAIAGLGALSLLDEEMP
jgi:hypothetical protein